VYAIGSLLLLVALSLLIIRGATVVLTATGMAAHQARFQARSAFTGAGFTTSESESVVNHPIRRKVIGMLMLLGNIGIVGAAATLIVGFGGTSAPGAGWRLLELVIGLFALIALSRSRWVDRRVTAAVTRALDRHTDIAERDLGGLLQLTGDYCVEELAVAPGDWVAGRSLDELALRKEGVVVLAVVRSDGSYLGAPDGGTVIAAGDTLIVYGRGGRLRELDRRDEQSGERAHAEAVREHHAVRGPAPQ
jgi:TrkA-C domain